MPGDAASRFPGFDVLGQRAYWDAATDAVLARRQAVTGPQGFFSAPERRTATVLLTRLLDLAPDDPVPVVALVESRLATGSTDGWRYADLPDDGPAWHASLAALDRAARVRCGEPFDRCPATVADALICEVRDAGSRNWQGLPGAHLWSLWTRYACTAYYSHPLAWQEIGWPGPAYPRGYKNTHIDGREPFEVKDISPDPS